MEAGKLRHLVTIEAPPSGAADALGHTTGTWSTFAEVYAAIEEADGSERWAQQQGKVEAVITHRLKVRYLAGLTQKHRVVYDGRILHLIEPPRDPEGRRREHVFRCTEKV